jgi:tripartite-type tricarboxylate transporter receptor subunit TctC
MNRVSRRALLGVAAALPLRAALAQSPWPARPVRIIVPFAPGGSSDVLARLIAERLAPVLGQPVLVENRPGASGNTGIAAVAAAPKDGHTLVLVASGFVTNPSLFAQVPYDALRDFAPISYVASAPSALAVTPTMQATTLQELIALAKAQPGLFYSTPGAGSAQHLTGELLKLQAGIALTHVPFAGAGPAITAALGGHVPITISSLPGAQPHMAAGRLRGLGLTTLRRSSAVPDLPTFDEQGLPGFEVDHLQGLLAPAGTPPEIVQRVSAEVARIIAQPDARDRLLVLGFEPVGSTPEQFRRTIEQQLVKWADVIRRGGIRLD